MLIIVLLTLTACTQTKIEAKDISALAPKEVVESYFNSWAAKDYQTMYSLISDGFKKIEPTATTYDKFEAEISKYYDTANGIKLLETGDVAIEGDSATVSYKIELGLKTGKKTYDGVYTLRKRANGWKLIHPYGQNIDTS